MVVSETWPSWLINAPAVSAIAPMLTVAVAKSFFATVAVAPPLNVTAVFSAKVPVAFDIFTVPIFEV